MIKLISCILLTMVIVSSNNYVGSTTGVVTLAGGIIKAKHVIEKDKKYPRKKCPVCKGTGKYLSGDDIKMVDCGYCEPENKATIRAEPEVKCIDNNCRIPK